MAEEKNNSLNIMPVSEVATLDFVNNPDRQGTGGLNRDSSMFEAMLLHTTEQESTELYRRYDEAFTAANLKDDFQPKIAILQLREGEENHNRHFMSLESLDRIMHEQPNCANYELVYVRNAEEKAETEQEQERLNNQLYAEFNANTLRPRDYYGHSLSVGDVIVIANDFSEQHAYFVDNVGFTKLPDDFLSHEMSAKIRNDLDIRQEGILFERIGQYEAENALSVMDKSATDRYFQITSEYSRIFELADRRGAIMDMDALGYEPAQVDGFSDDFLMWKPKNENEEENTFGFDGWNAVKDFTYDVNTLMNNYTVQELQDRANGDYNTIEYGTFDDRAVQTALNNSGFHIRGFEVKDMVYMANFTYNGKDMQSAVWQQGEDYYISVGSRIRGDLTRHDFTLEEKNAYNAFVAENSREQQERNSSFTAENEPLLAEDITNIRGVDIQHNAGMRETTYTFECDVRDVHDILTYEVSQHDDGASYTIHTETNDIWENMSEPELEKLEAVLSREATYFVWQQRIENAVTMNDLQDVKYGFMEAENLNLSQEQRENLYNAMDLKENSLQETEREEQIDRERSGQEVAQEENVYKYYFNQTALNGGTYPIENFEGINEYSELTHVPEINQNVWGELTYSKPLTSEQEQQYNLIPSPSNIRDKEMAQEYTPIPNHYYEPDLDLDGTAEELFVQARNGYIENPDALHRLTEILEQENRTEEAERVKYMEEREREEDTDLYSVSQMKLDFMDGIGGIEDVAIGDGLNLSVMYEPSNDSVAVSLSQMWQDGNEDVLSTGAANMSLEEFKQMSRADFERFVNDVNAYNMVEQERVPNIEREQELDISYFVAEAMEFHTLGAVYEDIPTIEEAINVFENLPETSRNMGNGIGAIINGDEYSLYENGHVDTLEFYEDNIKNNANILNAIKVLNERFSDNEQEVNHGDNERNPFNETNFKIQSLTGENSFVVRSDSERFGNNEIVYQATSYEDCLNYISERVDNIEPSYYVIKDLASWRSDVWENPPERSAVERFETVEEAIAKFNEYKGMDYLKQEVVEPNTHEPMRRLALGVSYAPHRMAEMDVLHVERDKTLLLSDAIAERDNGYENFMTNNNFIRDLNKITASIQIDEYSYYRDSTLEELVDNRLAFLEENYPEEPHSREEAARVAEEYIRRHPNYLRSNQVNERVAFEDFTPPFLNKNEDIIKPVKYVALQNENTRYTFSYDRDFDRDYENYHVNREQLLGVGSETSHEVLSVDEANKKIADLKSKGFLEFRNANEVSWYATIENNTPYAENWEVKDGILIPIESHSVGITNDEQEINHGDNMVEMQSASLSNYEGYTVLSQFDRDGNGNIEDKVFLGKTENYDNKGNYDNSDNSLVYISDNLKMEAFLNSGEGWTESQQTMLDKGAFTQDDYSEFANLKETVLQQFTEIRPKKFEIDINDSESGVPFQYENEESMVDMVTIDGQDCTKIDEWQNDTESYVVGELSNSDGVYYLAQVTDNGEQFKGIYNYEFDDKPSRSDVEDEHLNNISSIDIDRHEAEFGADGSRAFPNLNDPSPKEEQEELRQIVAEKSAPVEIDDTLPPKDQLKQRLENGVRQVLDSDQFKNWLSTGGKLFYNNYSFRNAMLVWLQKPEASHVMGYEKWKEYGRNVKQGAQGAKIFIPLMAGEKYKGGLFRSIKSNLNEQLSKDPSLKEASYRLGTSNLEFTMNKANHLIGFKVNGKEQQIFNSDEEAKRFIDRAIIGKVPTGFTVGTVFDAKDVIVPEYLWVKSGYTKDEIAPDEKGNPMKNRRGEVRIFNTPERQARFQTSLDTKIVAKDPVKMQALFDACVAASERKGVPVSLAEKADDSTLDGGAKGYYSRQFSEDKPNGFIVIDNSLEITEKCAVLLHEMGHADLHKNLDALAKSMGEEKISREMREVQAEATAFSVASTFGIETDTSSFKYLAAYARGFELQDFQKSLDVIFKETQALTNDIKAELDIRGLNLDLTEKPKAMLDKETLETLSTKYMDFATEQGSKVQAALNELPSLIKQSAENPELMDVLKYQKENLDSRKEDLDIMLTAVENLNTVDTREKQDDIINTLDATMSRVSGNSNAFENLSERYVVIAEQARGGLKVDFDKNPLQTLESMKKSYPELAKLSNPQLQYIAASKFVSREFSKLLRNNPQKFVDKATERAALISKAASKNGTFVEINYCEQWTDKPFFEKGTLCSPKIADKTITGCEAQVRGFKAEAEKRGDYFPYTKCDMTIFTPNKDGNLASLTTRVDIGDGTQKSLKDHLEQLSVRVPERKEMLNNFMDALSERADKRKLIVQDLSDKPKTEKVAEKPVAKEGSMTHDEWDKQIKVAKAEKSTDNELSNGEHDKSKNKKSIDRES